MAATLIENASIRSIERELRELGEAAAEPGQTTLRTRVLTHLAWVPDRWEPAARAVLAGLGERHPSRTIMLLPDPESDRDALDAEVDLRCFTGAADRSVCSEVIVIWLRGGRASAPASVVEPLLVPDLPVFLRWRGEPPFGSSQLDQLVEVANRLVVSSREWDDLATAYARLPELFDRVVVSDISWAWTLPWRAELAALWPAVAEVERLRVFGPEADAVLLAGWLCARLGHPVELVHEQGEELEAVEADGKRVSLERAPSQTPSGLLSAQLEIDGRDPIYEEAVRAGAAIVAGSARQAQSEEEVGRADKATTRMIEDEPW